MFSPGGARVKAWGRWEGIRRVWGGVGGGLDYHVFVDWLIKLDASSVNGKHRL